jgi:hypothetical protein
MSTPEKFMSDLRRRAKDHDINIKFTTKEMVYPPGDPLGCTGYFDENDLVLCVSNSNSEQIFITNLVHESSHMDQFIQDKYLWEKCSPGYSIFFKWLEGSSIVKYEVLEEAVQDIIRIELDCEHRSLKKIKHYNLDIDTSYYIRQTNAYLYGYLFALETRHWTPQIYFNDKVVAASSSRLKKSYDKIPIKLHRIFLRQFKAK